MFTTTFWWNTNHSAFENFQECLLHTLTGNIAGNGDVCRFTGNFIDLINVDNTTLRPFKVEVRSMKQSGKYRFNIITNISRFGQRCGINNGKGYFKQIGKSLGKEGFSCPGRSNKHDIAFFNNNFIMLMLVLLGIDPFVVVINRHGE